MDKISYEGIGEVVATCIAEGDVCGGTIVKMSGANTVTTCSDGDLFCGMAMQPRDSVTSVQFKGFMTVCYEGEKEYGWVNLVSDGQGGVKEAETGVTAQLIQRNDNGTAVICL